MSFGKRVNTGQTFLNRRRAPRKATKTPGEIVVPAQPPFRCVVLEYSSTGARIDVPNISFAIPNKFELKFFGRIHQARIVRRMPRALIVTFPYVEH
jgi:hypothetical protein